MNRTDTKKVYLQAAVTIDILLKVDRGVTGNGDTLPLDPGVTGLTLRFSSLPITRGGLNGASDEKLAIEAAEDPNLSGTRAELATDLDRILGPPGVIGLVGDLDLLDLTTTCSSSSFPFLSLSPEIDEGGEGLDFANSRGS